MSNEQPTTNDAAERVPAKQKRGGRAAYWRHGLRGTTFPPQLTWMKRTIDVFRREVERAVLVAKGEISLVDAATINTIYRMERHAQLATHWLTTHADELSPADKLKFSWEAARASAERDKALRSLGLDQRAADLIDAAIITATKVEECQPQN